MSDMTYLVEYEIKSHGIISSQHKSLTFNHPKHNVSIELKNKTVELGQYEAILNAYVIIETDSFEKAESESLVYLKEFVDMLTFTTNMNFSIGNIIKIIDWSLGVEERECLIYHKFPGDERPYPVLNGAPRHLVWI